MTLDFGFGAFLEKFEGYFGKTLTKLLIGLMAMTVVVVCLGLLYKGAVSPIVHLLASYSKYDATIIRFAAIGWTIAAVGAGLQVGISLSQSIRRFFASRMLLQSAKLVVAAHSSNIDSRSISREVRVIHEEAQANLVQTRALHEAVLKTTRTVIDAAKQLAQTDELRSSAIDHYVEELEALYAEAKSMLP